MSVKRVLSAILGFPLVIAILVIKNNYIIDVAFSIIAIIAIKEYFNAFKGKIKLVEWLGYVLAISISFMHIAPMTEIIPFIIPMLIIILFIQVVFSNMKTNIQSIAISLFGIIYVIGFIAFIPLLRAEANGSFLVWYILIIAWGTDTFAYIIGKKFGKNKISTISPNKTREGAIGGIIGAILISLGYTIIINNYCNMNLSYIYIGVISFILSVLSQIGDIAASSIKRYTNIKDFGNLIPGHGGILDRIDSVIFIAPITYFLLIII